MASEKASPSAGRSDLQPPADAPPAYNEITGTLDIRQDGFSTQTQVRGRSLTFLPFNDSSSP
jgi:hypothetical protein